MEYVAGESLARLLRRLREKNELVPPAIAAAVMCNVLDGLHAAHEARDESGVPLNIVHRDVSPQNVLVGADGIARVLDFGIAKARGRHQEQTREGQLKGKLAYMAPEQLDQTTSRATDVYAASVVFWETLTCSRLMQGETEAQIVMKILAAKIAPPSASTNVTSIYDELVMKGLATNAEMRFATAREMSAAIPKCGPRADAHEVAEWLEKIASETLSMRAQAVSMIESAPSISARGATDDVATRSDLTRDAPKARSSKVFAIAAAIAAIVAVAVFGSLRYRASHERIAAPSADPAASPLEAPMRSASVASAAPLASSAAPAIASSSPAPVVTPHPSAKQAPKPKLPDFL
jgi:serine/threonine-protein kinase